MGIEVVVQQVMIQDRMFYWVWVGLYMKIDELNKVCVEFVKFGVDV